MNGLPRRLLKVQAYRLRGWRPGPVPADFQRIRDRWEFGHMVVAGIKLAGFVMLAIGLPLARPARQAGPPDVDQSIADGSRDGSST